MKGRIAFFCMISIMFCCISPFSVAAKNLDSSQPMSVNEFERYLNYTYSSAKTPMGEWELEHNCDENDSSDFPYDYWIQTDWSYTDWEDSFSPYDIEYSLKYTEEEKQKTKEILRNIQINIAKDAEKCFPGKKIEGGYWSGYYRYPSLKVGYNITCFLTWKNYEEADSWEDDYDNSYLDSFRWDPIVDDYDFTDGETFVDIYSGDYPIIFPENADRKNQHPQEDILFPQNPQESQTPQVSQNTDLVYQGIAYKGSIMFDTASYCMRPGDLYDIGVVMAGNASTKSLSVYSSRPGIATVSKLSSGNFRIVGISPGITYIVLEVWDNGKILNHYSVKIAVENNVVPHGQAARSKSYFN